MATVADIRSEVIALLRQAIALLDPAGADEEPLLEPAELRRIETVGKMAHLHLAFMERHGGKMTIADSRVIRRKHYGDKVRSTANLFGTADSGAILYRPVPYGTRTMPDQEVRLTTEGTRLAAAYRRLHNLHR